MDETKEPICNVRIVTTPPNLNVPDNFYGIYDIYSSSVDFNKDEHEQFQCRYCGEVERTKFRKIAHLMPEFTGNKDVISRFECDTCNAKFGKYESSLSAFGGIRNAFSLIKKKSGGYPKFKDEKNGMELQFVDGILEMKIKDVNSSAFKLEPGKVTLQPIKQSYIPRYVLKSLVKIGIGLLKKEDVKHFPTTLNWLVTPDDNITETHFSPMTLYGNEIRPPQPRPVAILCRKKEKVDYNSPEFCLLFFYGFHIYQVFIPFCELDNRLDLLNIYHPVESNNILKKKELKETFTEFVDGKPVTKYKYTCTLKFKEMKSLEKTVGELDSFESGVTQRASTNPASV